MLMIVSLQSPRSAITTEYDYYHHHPYCKLFVVCLLFAGDFLLIVNDYLSNCGSNNLLINSIERMDTTQSPSLTTKTWSVPISSSNNVQFLFVF